MQNRREFFLNTLKTVGASAVLQALDAEHLLAIPTASVVGEDSLPPTLRPWTWDGTVDDYLERLNALVGEHLAGAGHVFRGPLAFSRPGEVADGLTATNVVNAGFTLERTFRLGSAGLGPRYAGSPDDLVVDGMQLLRHRSHVADPVASIDVLAEGFANRIRQRGGIAYGTLCLPDGLFVSRQLGAFRLVCDYDIAIDHMVLRFDTLFAARET